MSKLSSKVSEFVAYYLLGLGESDANFLVWDNFFHMAGVRRQERSFAEEKEGLGRSMQLEIS